MLEQVHEFKLHGCARALAARLLLAAGLALALLSLAVTGDALAQAAQPPAARYLYVIEAPHADIAELAPNSALPQLETGILAACIAILARLSWAKVFARRPKRMTAAV